MAYRADIAVHRIGPDIPGAGETQHRQHQEIALPHTPITQGLTEVLVMLGQTHGAGYIEKAQHTQGAVIENPGGVLEGLFALELQHIVEYHHHIPQIAKEVGYAIIDNLGGQLLIGLGHRFEQNSVQGFVELVDGSVIRFQGIGPGCSRVADRGAAGQQGCQSKAHQRTPATVEIFVHRKNA